MKKRWYDHKCTLCPVCGWYRPEGPRPESQIDPGMIWPEACGKYGYSLHEYDTPADECEGFATPAQVQRRMAECEQRKGRK